MSFVIVQTRKNKKSKPCMTVVPSKWAKKDQVYWPPSNFVTLSADRSSEPIMGVWSNQKCKIVGHGTTYASAEELMRRLEVQTDSEDALQFNRGTRANPGKKKSKLDLKQYELFESKKDTDVSRFASANFNESAQTVHGAGNGNQRAMHDGTVYIEPHGDMDIPAEKQSNMNSTVNQSMNPWIITAGDGKQYVQLDDGTCLEIVADTRTNDGFQIPLSNISVGDSNINEHNTNDIVANINPIIDDQAGSVTLSGHIQNQDADSSIDVQAVLENLQTRVTRIEGMLEKVLMFMANMNKLLEDKSTQNKSPQKEKNRTPENFSEFSNIFPVKDIQSLADLNSKLNNQHYAQKLFRYTETMFNLSGKREGKPFFRTLLRKLVDPVVMTHYSWLGNTRTKKGEKPCIQNMSFKKEFPVFVEFVGRIVRAADFEFSIEATEDSFCQFLRQKNTELKRHRARNGASKRSHTKKKRAEPTTADHGNPSPMIFENTQQQENDPSKHIQSLEEAESSIDSSSDDSMNSVS